MNKAIHKLTFLLSLTALLTACSQDDAPVTLDSYPDTLQITVTRSTASGDAEVKTIFQNGTEVGLSVQGSSAYSNMKYEYRDGTLKPKGEKIFWNTGSLTVNAYYPYRNDGNYTNPPVYEDQSTEANYYLSDALHATGTVSKTDNSMSLDFKHRTAKMIFTFTEDVDEVTIANQPLTQGGEATHTIKAYKETARKWKACIIPQTNLTVNVKKSTKVYQAGLTENFSGTKQYAYQISTIESEVKDLSAGNVSIADNGTYSIKQSGGGTTGNSISITGSPTVYLHGVNISSSTALSVSNGEPTLILVGSNTLKSTTGNAAGIQLNGADAHVIIKGSGYLEVTCGPSGGNYSGAGIGTASEGTCGNISIEGGTIHAVSDRFGAAIGGGDNSTCGNITIRNATVTALLSGGGGAAIGSGEAHDGGSSQCGNITIIHSTVTTTVDEKRNGFHGPAIGCGHIFNNATNSCGDISITLKAGDTKDSFLGRLGSFDNADKVGKGNSDGTVGAITWYDSDGTEIK